MHLSRGGSRQKMTLLWQFSEDRLSPVTVVSFCPSKSKKRVTDETNSLFHVSPRRKNMATAGQLHFHHEEGEQTPQWAERTSHDYGRAGTESTSLNFLGGGGGSWSQLQVLFSLFTLVLVCLKVKMSSLISENAFMSVLLKYFNFYTDYDQPVV